ncbi:MAG: WxcM-like domain-containing protein [Oscillospiraceae bacterium]|nr:WxcM-like domain-containing protein [Oscillospiraceae bacterium]
MEIKTYRFPPHGDDRGQLVALEALEDIPFEIKRVYYIYDTLPDVVRGKHAHRCLEQILICVHGSCKVALEDGQTRQEICLDDPTLGLYISNDTWREMYDFSEGAVLLVLASEHYDEADYIREYTKFLEMVQGKREERHL